MLPRKGRRWDCTPNERETNTYALDCGEPPAIRLQCGGEQRDGGGLDVVAVVGDVAGVEVGVSQGVACLDAQHQHVAPALSQVAPKQRQALGQSASNNPEER